MFVLLHYSSCTAGVSVCTFVLVIQKLTEYLPTQGAPLRGSSVLLAEIHVGVLVLRARRILCMYIAHINDPIDI